MSFLLRRAVVTELIDDYSCYVEVTGYGRMLASRSAKIKRAVPVLAIGLVVAVQFSPVDKTRCRITYHTPPASG